MTKKQKIKICDLSLIGLTVIILTSGVQLEIIARESLSWIGVHIAVGLIYFALAAWHIALHFPKRNWFKALRKQNSPVTRFLAIIAALTILSGIAAVIQWLNHSLAHTSTGGVHGKIGFLFIILAVAHTIKRIQSPVLK